MIFHRFLLFNHSNFACKNGNFLNNILYIIRFVEPGPNPGPSKSKVSPLYSQAFLSVLCVQLNTGNWKLTMESSTYCTTFNGFSGCEPRSSAYGLCMLFTRPYMWIKHTSRYELFRLYIAITMPVVRIRKPKHILTFLWLNI